VFGVPGQPATVGVTVIVAVIAAAVALVAVKEGVFPVPEAAKPMAAFELVQVNVPPAGVLTKADVGTLPPLQTVMFAGTVTVGVGLTVMLYELGVPTQPAKVGVTVIVPEIAAALVFVAVNDGTFPIPDAPIPIAVLVFVHV
jgi:hypothetical protein